MSIFVALLFLLIGDTPPYHVNGLPVNMPAASSALPQPGALREDAITVSVTRDGHYFFGKTEVEPQEIPTRIWESIRGGSEIKAYLRADGRARTAEVNRAIDEIRRAGIRDLVILTNRRAS